jgi:hypothetical protein
LNYFKRGKTGFWIFGFSEEFLIENFVATLIGDYLMIKPSSKGIIWTSTTWLTKCHSWLTNLAFENLLIFPQI